MGRHRRHVSHLHFVLRVDADLHEIILGQIPWVGRLYAPSPPIFESAADHG